MPSDAETIALIRLVAIILPLLLLHLLTMFGNWGLSRARVIRSKNPTPRTRLEQRLMGHHWMIFTLSVFAATGNSFGRKLLDLLPLGPSVADLSGFDAFSLLFAFGTLLIILWLGFLCAASVIDIQKTGGKVATEVLNYSGVAILAVYCWIIMKR